MKLRTLLINLFGLVFCQANAQLPTQKFTSRGMWASVNTVRNASLNSYANHTNKLLISWRMLPTDTWDTSFLIYSRSAALPDGVMQRNTLAPVKNATCAQISTLPSAKRVYYLIDGNYFNGATPPATINSSEQRKLLREAALDSLIIGENIYKNKLPYVSIPLKDTEDVSNVSAIKYQANDCTVADLDGDGVMEIIVKRLLSVYNSDGTVASDGTGAGASDSRARHCVIWDAYKLDGTLLWRVMSGPNIILGNSSNFAVADLDGDGCAEFVTKTGEGTVFGDGTEIGDTNNDGITDYRSRWPGHYTGDSSKGFGGPEFFSVVDGKTGKELARANFIARGPEGQTEKQWVTNYKNNSLSWGDDYWKRANSLRLGVAAFKGDGTMQVFLGRGVYARTVVEGWDFQRKPDTEKGLECSLTRLWKFDTGTAGGSTTNKDGKANSAYAGQGNHAFNVTDLDGDGKDEVMYGSAAFDDDGTGLWTTQLGHGDANHVGAFLPDREGMQVYHCLESGKTQVALHDAATGAVIWQKVGTADNDMGRCMVADVDPNSPGCEFWMYGNSLYSQTGTELNKKVGSCNMAIWFDGYLTRQLIDGNKIDGQDGRTFTVYRYDVGVNNGTKNNPGWYGDFLGDWREELIMPDATHLKDIKIFSTWYPSSYKFPYLMSDHNYFMQTIHQQVGYNQPNHIGGYYLGNGMDMTKVPLTDGSETAGIQSLSTAASQLLNDARIFDLSGRVVTAPKSGIYIKNGRKLIVK
jgi:rhamnogalacturonan endolyase